MGLRKAAAYSFKRARPYVRHSRVKSKSYIKTLPQQKIVKFRMGKIADYEKGKFKYIARQISTQKVLLRDNALEACRQFIHKHLEKEFAGQYFFEVKVFPHHILRENKMLTGAGSDRMQTGMQKSFGTTQGRAAMVKKNQTVFLVGVLNDKGFPPIMKIFNKIKSKIPCKSRLSTEKVE